MTPREKHLQAIAEIADEHGYTVEDILGPCRHKHLVSVRHQCFAMFYDRGYSTPEIGRIMNRDHSTVCHALNKRAI